jgi:hypothetical protein
MISSDGSNRVMDPSACAGMGQGGGDPDLFGGLQFVYVQDPMTELASCPSVLIRQEPEFLEAITGCEEPNIYHVFGNSPYGFKYLFKCLEQSECCERFFCPSQRRQFNMDIIHCNSYDQLGMEYITPFANLNKPFMCTMGCFCRPEITISINRTKKIVGKALHIWTCCNPTFELYDSKGILKYIVTADCCQCVLLCPGMIGKSYEGEFDILEPNTGTPVGKIMKMPASYSELVTDADSYTVNFPANATAYDKLLLMGLTILADYQYFETNASNNNRRGRRGGFGGMMALGLGMDEVYGYGGGIGAVHMRSGPRARVGGVRIKKKRRK